MVVIHINEAVSQRKLEEFVKTEVVAGKVAVNINLAPGLQVAVGKYQNVQYECSQDAYSLARIQVCLVTKQA